MDRPKPRWSEGRMAHARRKAACGCPVSAYTLCDSEGVRGGADFPGACSDSFRGTHCTNR